MSQILRQSTQIIVRLGPAVAVGDGFTPVTSLTLGSADEAELLKANTTTTTDISGATMSAITGCDGWYGLTLTTSHTDTVGCLDVMINDDSLILPIFARFQVIEEAAYDAIYAASADPKADINVGSIDANAITATSIASDAITAAKIADGAIDAATFAANAITSTVLANDCITDAKVASDVTIASVTGAVGSVTGNVGGNVAGTIGGLTAAALADFFDTDSGTTYASAVAGSVVKEIADNAGGSSLTEAGIAETVCEYMHTFDTTLGVGDVVAGSVMANQQVFAFTFDSGTTYASAVAGSVVKEIVDNGATPASIAAAMFTEDTGLDAADIVAGSPFHGLLRGQLLYDVNLTYNDVEGASVFGVFGLYLAENVINSNSIAQLTCESMFTYNPTIGFAGAAPGSVMYELWAGMIAAPCGQTFASSTAGCVAYEIATNTGNPWTTVIDGTYTAQECIRLIGAAVAGESEVSGNSVSFRDLNDTKNRIAATTNAEGDRSAITYDAS